LKKYSLVGTRSLHRIVEIVEEAINDNVVKALETGEMPPLDLPKIRKNPVIEIIPISRGCVSECAFCKVKEARSDLRSYPIEDIVKVAAMAVSQGVKEIWLTSQDCFCYGFDIDTSLPSLLKELMKLPGQFMVRVGMGNPANLKKIKDEFFPLLNEKRMFKYLHAPLQSGSNKVLKDMKREYTHQEYGEMISEVKRIVPEVHLVTDVIVGYPTEKEEDYWETLTLFRKVNPALANISRFWPRSKTPAAKLKMLPKDEIAHRLKVLNDIFENISKLHNERWLDWKGDILIDEKVEKREEKKTEKLQEKEEEAIQVIDESKKIESEKSKEIAKEEEKVSVKEREKNSEKIQASLKIAPEKRLEEKMRFERPFLEKQVLGKTEEEKDNVSRFSGVRWIGRNESYKPIIVHGDFKLGDVVKVKVIKVNHLGLWGKIV
ncbi:MiaB/RimO family radical SAM methylthiotransferase, partial [Candidatus Woesearchaeota archaeon]|nr:MiaB/RimO family radical SAM methylthiotransferase [Candidatus Woesearchaeota archaeon]